MRPDDRGHKNTRRSAARTATPPLLRCLCYRGACLNPDGSFSTKILGSNRPAWTLAPAPRCSPTNASSRSCAAATRPRSRRSSPATRHGCCRSAGTCSARERTPRMFCRRCSRPPTTRCSPMSGRSTCGPGSTGSPEPQPQPHAQDPCGRRRLDGHPPFRLRCDDRGQGPRP